MNSSKPEIEKEKRSFWTLHIQKQTESGQSQKVYCRENGLALSTFGYWKTKLSEKVAVCQDLVEINLRPEMQTSTESHLFVQIKDRFQIRITDHTDFGLLEKTLSVFERL